MVEHSHRLSFWRNRRHSHIQTDICLGTRLSCGLCYDWHKSLDTSTHTRDRFRLSHIAEKAHDLNNLKHTKNDWTQFINQKSVWTDHES